MLGLVAPWILLFSLNASHAAPPYSGDQLRAIWENATSRLAQHPQTIFDNGREPISEYPGYLTPNGVAYIDVEIPAGPAGLLVGAGTLTNLNLAAARGNPGLIFVDQSLQVLMSVVHFWSTLFIAAEAPQDWLAYGASLPGADGQSVEQVFGRILAGEKGTYESLQRFATRLDHLVASGQISDLDRQVTLAILDTQLRPQVFRALTFDEMSRNARFAEGAGFFRNVRGVADIFQQVARLYWPPALSEKFLREKKWVLDRFFKGEPPSFEKVDQKARSLSFLLDPEAYRRLREIFRKRRVWIGRGDIRDPALWESVGRQAIRAGLDVTDVYVNNIPEVLSREERDAFPNLLENDLLSRVPGQRIAVYEALTEPHPIQTRTMVYDNAKACRLKYLPERF